MTPYINLVHKLKEEIGQTQQLQHQQSKQEVRTKHEQLTPKFVTLLLTSLMQLIVGDELLIAAA